jgi:membrane-associated phospholipid phosphatase
MSQTEFLVWITNNQLPFLNQIAQILTFMGNEEFYLLIIPLVYWCFSKTIGFRLLYIFIFSVYVNSFIKIHTAIARPVGVENIQSLFLESAEVGSHYPRDSFPSGHAQGSATLWGYLAYKVATPLFWIVAITLIFFISVTRLYTGLHWPIDIISGILIAIFILVLGIKIENKLVQLPKKIHWLLVVIVPLLLVVLFPQSDGYKYAGFLLGAGIAYLIEASFVQMNLNTAILKKLIAYIIGVAGIVILQVGINIILPEVHLSDFLRYGLVGVWGLLGAPWLFVKLGLFPSDRHIERKPSRPPVAG